MSLSGVKWKAETQITSEKDKLMLVEEISDQGHVSGRGTILNGYKHGQWITFNKDGLISAKEYFTNGLKNGIARYMDFKCEHVQIESNYVNGLLHGLLTKYDNGSIIKTETYCQGKKTGPYFECKKDTFWYGHYNDSWKSGTWLTYKWKNWSEEVLIKKEVYAAYGRCIGIYYYHENGKIKEFTEGGDEDCHKNGIWSYYDTDGILTHKYTHKNSAYPCGLATFYNSDGSVKQEVMYCAPA